MLFIYLKYIQKNIIEKNIFSQQILLIIVITVNEVSIKPQPKGKPKTFKRPQREKRNQQKYFYFSHFKSFINLNSWGVLSIGRREVKGLKWI